MLTVLSVIGTRPEAVKMAPIVRELKRHGDRIDSRICVTGQHRQMLDQVLGVFRIEPDYDLNVMRSDQSLAELTAALFQGLDGVVGAVRPDWVLAQGDTTTVMVAAMVAYYRRVRFGHVEAGLRTGNLAQPFPEEANRRIADLLADLHFAPTETSRQALRLEGVPESRVILTGNTVIDALRIATGLPYDWTAGPLARLPAAPRRVVITAHRRESFGAPLEQVCLAVRDLAEAFGEEGVHFAFPVHLNPSVQDVARRTLSGLPNVSLIEPLDYLSMIHLMARATLILTDSGGIQEEAAGLRVPVLVLRDTTERPEGIESGYAKLVGTDRARIVAEASRVLREPAATPVGENPYGDGHAAERIVAALLRDVRISS
jgi:UDP-N-acetylglucosamine 2-epimerase (non-hydrolysing)